MATASMDAPVVATAAQPQTPSRKRRRRAPATGASEDCHTCRKRGTSCDRRRPYCSQCLEIGKECSGYRTTLTWGVGVASRGKLRGKSLPVLNMVGPPVGPQSKVKTPEIAVTPANGTHGPAQQRQAAAPPPQAAYTNDVGGSRKRARVDSYAPPLLPTSAPPHITSHSVQANRQQYHRLPSPPPSIADAEHHPEQRKWLAQPPQFRQQAHDATTQSQQPLTLSIQPQQQHPQLRYETVTHAAPVYRPTEDRTYEQYPQTPESAPHFTDPFSNQNQYNNNAPPPHSVNMRGPPQGHFHVEDPTQMAANMPQQPLPWSPSQQHANAWPSAEQNFNNQRTPSWQSVALSDTGSMHSMPLQPPSPHISFQQHSPNSGPLHFDFDEAEEVDGEYSTADGQALVAQNDAINIYVNPQNVYNVTPRMRYILDYYDKFICSVLVAFDDSSNPYRAHILPLAMQNKGLQNALAALVTNNMRMKTVENLPVFHRGQGTKEIRQPIRIARPSSEEQHYKSMSIELLNKQLADPFKARDDSTLATLLILCLFHVCDSGFSKFKTQLAGVQKLLKLRGGNDKFSAFVGWVEMFFAWFDVMTSAINDRELQITGDSLDLMDLSKNLGALEQFSGCDGRLFKLIARLGRLNLLSQGRPVRAGVNKKTNDLKVRDFYSMNFDDEFNLDPSSTQNSNNGDWDGSPPPDGRIEFWTEWKDVRKRLQELALDGYSPRMPSDGEMPGRQLDMMHISESFRFAALLYTERLAHPSSPASSAQFQDLVDRSMYHIREIGVNSCVLKFMLWPIFITGTECVRETDRDVIREMCVEIQKESGFYNNVSGLELLERVWNVVDSDDGRPRGCAPGGQAFAWGKAMDRVDGEYIVL